MGGQHIYYSNMTPSEEFRLNNGSLSSGTIEKLLDTHESLGGIDSKGAMVHIKEARGCFAKEDFLTSAIRDLTTIANRLRGRNKLELLDQIQKLRNIESAVFQEGEYGSDELKKAYDCLKTN